MNCKPAISVFVALTMATGPLAFAQGYGTRDDRGRNEQAQRGGDNDRRGNEMRRSNRRAAPAYQHDNRGFGRAHEEERSRGRGAGPNYEYYRGDRLPAEYRHRNYVVDDWRGHNLSAPPRGYQWVQSGSDYILVAIATGIILQLLLNH